MFGSVFFLGILAGVDNLQACSAIGLLPIRSARKHLLAVAFTGCETIAPLVGLVLGHFVLRCTGGAAARIGPFMMLACGIAVLFCAVRREDLSSLVNGRKMILGVPLALSFDNLLAGAGISALHFPVVASALLIGFISAAMSCIGLYLGSWIKRFVPDRVELAVGAYLCLLAGRALLVGGA
jgi:manganese efflux pump family protein